jgi:hypothetical protein
MVNQNGKTTVVGLFRTREDTDKAIQVLKERGIEDAQISLTTHEQAAHDIKADYISPKEEVTFGRLAGATAGATVGIFAGILIGLNVIAGPGVGPVLSMGATVTVLGLALVGAMVGAIIGSLLMGSLAKMGLPKEETHLHAEGANQDRLLVAVQTDETHVEEVEKVLDDANVADMNVLREEWHEDGQNRFDKMVEPNGNYPKL